MASPAQILANRNNAHRSTGPKTAEGKQAASHNATRHGLAGTQIVIPGEDATPMKTSARDSTNRTSPPTKQSGFS